jgi:dGTPase
MPDGREPTPQSNAAVRAAVTYVAGMTDRYAFDMAVRHLRWPPGRLPRGIDREP